LSQVDKPAPRYAWTGIAMAGFFSLAAASQLKLQTIERKSTLDLAKQTKRYSSTRFDYARRGSIFASDGKPLAQDEDASELNVQFEGVPKSEAFFMALGEASGIPASEFQSLAQQKVKQGSWRQPMSAARAEAIERVKKDWRADGVSLAHTGRRSYPLGDSASCLVGTYQEGKGLLGLEASKTKLLTGVDGKQVGLTDKKGAFLPMRLLAETKEKKDGANLTLTIDSNMQADATAAIRQAVEENMADNGVALVMDPHNGDILAMANWPSFAPYQADGSVGDMKNQTGYNPCYMAQLEPGSTFKILTLAKALDCGKASMDEVLNCPGEFHPTERTRIRCDSHHGNRAHGQVDAVKAIAKSCNVVAATWAMRIGRDPFLDYIRSLGLLSRCNLGVPTEAHGNFNYNEPSQKLQLATVGFGQSLTCTPIGLLGAFGMLGNDGARIAPRLIKRIGNVEQPVAAAVPVVSKETADKVLRCMEAVIETDAGTGKSLRIPGYRMGGKTGTAEKVGKGPKGYVSNFVGFVPSTAPKAIILVMVNNPKGGKYYGATVAGPVFKKMAQAVINHYHIAPTEPILPAKLHDGVKMEDVAVRHRRSHHTA